MGAYDIQPNGAWHEVLDKEDYHDITFNYQSAWSPARGLIQRISAQFPTLAFGVWYTEEGMGFAGWELYKGGEEISENSISLNNLPEYVWDDDASMEKHDQAMEEVYEALTSRPLNGEATPPTTQAFDETMLDTVLERKLQEKQAQELRNNNLSTVRDSLTEKFGEKASEVFGNKAKELGVNEAFLTDVAAKSPKAAMELFGLVKKDTMPSTAAPIGSINTQALAGTKPAPIPKAVMAGAKTEDILAAWRAVSPTNTQ